MYKPYLIFLFCFFFFGKAFAQAGQAGDRRKTYAVVIGIKDYENKAIPQLRFADKDATLFASFLQSLPGGSVPAEQIRLLLNEHATIAAIYSALDELKMKCGPEDLAVIFFAGHGDVETLAIKSEGYLLAYNSPPHNYRNNAISIGALNEDANTLTVKNGSKVLLITDACHSGKLAGDFIRGKQLAAKQLSLILNNQFRMASCSAGELAAEGTEWGGGRGVYSYYLLKGLQGFGDENNDGAVQFSEMEFYLKDAFSKDEALRLKQHAQQPVFDGHPAFVLAKADTQYFSSFRRTGYINSASAGQRDVMEGLDAFQSVVRMQPADYMVKVCTSNFFEDIIDFNSLKNTTAEKFPLQLMDKMINYLNALESRNKENPSEYEEPFAPLDSLLWVRDNFARFPDQRQKFIDQFLQLLHGRSQEMVNAYLEGDLEELEKRQYYNSGKRDYSRFLAAVNAGIKIAPPGYHLTPLLTLQQAYLKGLEMRLQMPFAKKTDSLRALAFRYQRKALKLDPYAAYIHNELGNLYMQKRRLDSAAYHFDWAAQLAPSWSVPWANRIRLNLASNKLDRAMEVARIADSLQPDLAYVQMNKGLVMEKQKNLLAAEMFYKQAIAANEVHFLPYERLGHIYLQTGNYEEADKFFFDAHLRKDAFAVNSIYYNLGPELGGPFQGMLNFDIIECAISYESMHEQKQPALLLRGLYGVVKDTPVTTRSIEMLESYIRQTPDLPLAHHYIGKHYFTKGDWNRAETFLTEAASRYRSDSLLFTYFISIYDGKPLSGDDSCLVAKLMNFKYHTLDDYYLLGKVNEMQQDWANALAWYKKATDLENQLLVAQARLEGYDARAEALQEEIWPSEELMFAYEVPVNCMGYIKQMEILEKTGAYVQAEEVLLNQIRVSRKAGDERQQAIQEERPGSRPMGTDLNYYYLSVNRLVEGVGYNFYNRMLRLFPREPSWYRKGASFLFNRLRLAYQQMNPALHFHFTESIKDFAYPWQAGEAPPEAEIIGLEVPGTGDSLFVAMDVYQPVSLSLEWYETYLSLTQQDDPEDDVVYGIASLNAWLGYTSEASQWYRMLIARHPERVALRNEVIGFYLANDLLVQAYEQMDSLYHRGQISQQQMQVLAGFHLYSGRHAEADHILAGCAPADLLDSIQVVSLKARSAWFAGNLNNALLYLRDSMPPFEILSIDSIFTLDQGIEAAIERAEKLKAAEKARCYDIARLYAAQKNFTAAFRALQVAFDKGFDYGYVLENDQLWHSQRNNRLWKDMMKRNPTKRAYETEGITYYDDSIHYRIPNQKGNWLQ